jgi:hypothetical protein
VTDQFWRDWFAERHGRHARRIAPWIRSAAAIVRLSVESLVGHRPVKTTAATGKPRIEMFLADRLAAVSAQVERAARCWNAARLTLEPDDTAAISPEKADLARTLNIEARRLWITADYYFCPAAVCAKRSDISFETARTFTLTLDRHLRHCAGLGGVTGSAASVQAAPEATALYERLVRCLEFLASCDPRWQDIARFRTGLLTEALENDRRRLEIAVEMRAWVSDRRGEDQDVEYVVSTLLETHIAARDWRAVIEECRQWQRGDRRLTVEMRRLLAESWFHYAFQIDTSGESALACFALDQAAGEFFAAGARESLASIRARMQALTRSSAEAHNLVSASDRVGNDARDRKAR